MVKKKNNTNLDGYVYGNVAYDYEKENNEVVKKKVKRAPKPKKKQVKKKNAKIRIVSSIAVVFLMSFIIVGRYTTILTLSSEIRSEKNEVTKIQKENQMMTVDLAKLNNLSAIEQEAMTKYGMVKPTNEQTYFINVESLDSSKEAKTENITKTSALSKIQRILGLIY